MYQAQQEISLNTFDSGTTQKLTFGFSTTIEIKNVTATSENTGTILSRKIALRCHYCRM